MLSPQESSSKVNDIDTRSVYSMQELEPSPVDDSFSDLETGDLIPKSQSLQPENADGEPLISKLGLRSHRWDPWCAFELL